MCGECLRLYLEMVLKLSSSAIVDIFQPVIIPVLYPEFALDLGVQRSALLVAAALAWELLTRSLSGTFLLFVVLP